ncbi:MAG: hypothetical protein R6X02_20545 [Enhygromyxa sp.]
MRRLSSKSLVLAALVLLACNKPSGDEDGEVCDMDFEQIRAEILLPTCTSEFCHDADAPAANLDFTRSAEGIAAQLVDVPSGVCADWVRVVPGDPERSILLAKLHDPPPCGERMPVDGHLSEHDIACLTRWVETVESTCETCGGDRCVDLQSDADHCGSCDDPCPSGVACVAGECTCSAGTELCGAACVDLDLDPEHCGGCDQPCDAGEACSAGTCVAGCEPGLEQCGGSCIDTEASAAHCGGCDSPCGAGLSCVAGECACADRGISFAAEVEPILVSSCAFGGCHAPPQIQHALDLRAGKAYEGLVGVASQQCQDTPRVNPGNPGDSYLLDKLLGVELCTGSQMPLNTEPLALADVELISDWICQGAPNN